MRRFIKRHPVGATMLFVAIFALTLSVLPLPEQFKPFPDLTARPARTLLVMVWPKAAATPTPTVAVLPDDPEKALVLPEFDLTGGGAKTKMSRGLSYEDEREGQRWETVIKKVQAQHVDIEEPCVEQNRDGACARSAMEPFFRALRAAREPTARSPVRVVVLGTSLIASDHITDVARRRLQARHGLGGTGYLYVDRPTRGAGRDVRCGKATEGWQIDKLTDEKYEGNIGLAGVAFHAPANDSQSVSFPVAKQRLAELFLTTQPNGGEIEIKVDGQLLGELSTEGDAIRPATTLFEIPEGSKRLELKTRAGAVRLDGVSVETGMPGLVFDALGLPGGAAYVFLRAGDEMFGAQLVQRRPALVVLMMGGNEAFDLSLNRYSLSDAQSNFEKLIDRVKSYAPQAACLLATPPDAGVRRMDKSIAPRKETAAVAAFLHKVAFAKGCAVWDMQAAMGGEGAIERWWEAGLMNEDLVHPVGVGGDVFGYLMDTAIERARQKHEAKLMAHAQKRVAPPPQRNWAIAPGRAIAAAADAGPAPPPVVPATGGSPDGGRRDNATRDGGSRGAGVRDAGVRDAGVRDGGGRDAGVRDAGVRDAGVRDGGVRDAGIRDGGVRDAGVRDAGVRDAGVRDAGVRDAGIRDAGMRDGSVRDAGVRDAGVRDAGVRDAGVRDAGVRDAGIMTNTGQPSGSDAGVFDGGFKPLRYPAGPGLSGPEGLTRFFERLKKLEAEKNGRVAIMQIGASHTAAQHFTDTARSALADRFGYAGRGYVAAGKASERLERSGVERNLTGTWTLLDAMKVKVPGEKWGLTGNRAIGRPGSQATFEFEEPRSGGDDSARVQVHVLEEPGMGPLQLFVDDKLERSLVTPPPDSLSRVRVLEVGSSGSHHVIRIDNPGPGDVTILGVSHELMRPGIVYDALGLPGSTAVTFSGYDSDTLVTQLKARQPDLYIMFFGTNEAAFPAQNLEAVRAAYPKIISNLRIAAPDAACLFLGPTDRMSKKKRSPTWKETESIDEVYDILREVAQRNGCAFWETRTAMGGEGSIDKWRKQKPPLANKDHVHLTHEGYRLLAIEMVKDLLEAYDQWLKKPLAKGGRP